MGAPDDAGGARASASEAVAPRQADLFGDVVDPPAGGGPHADEGDASAAAEPAPGERIVDVALARPLPPLSYRVPARWTAPPPIGALVEVPLRGVREIGCVVGVGEAAPSATPARRLRPLARRVAPAFALPPDLLALARWIADYYLCSWGEALACVSFIGFRDLDLPVRKAWRLADGAADAAERDATRLTPRQREVMRWMLARAAADPPLPDAPIADEELRAALGVTAGVLERLADCGLLRRSDLTTEAEEGFWRAKPPLVAPPPPLDLTPPQHAALDAIAAPLDDRAYAAFLLHGITGSGKTEVYLRALDRTLAQGRQAIVLVPEISLTPQTVARFAERFGARIGLYHSRLTPPEKLRLHAAIARGAIDVVVGARSAIFSPFARLGLVILDEEHETSYKQDSVPRYHARDVALVRARAAGAVVLLGSATPSLESRANAERGKLARLSLPGRVRDGALPEVEVVDMAAALRAGDVADHLSRPLREAIDATLATGHQALLLLNRRGYHAFFFCHACRDALRCDDCDIALTHHLRPPRLVCHLCGASRPVPPACPRCGGELSQVGLGTERLEEELARCYPGRRIVRIDQDTTRGRHDFAHHWERLAEGDVDIILGTQMIAKGLHLERVTLVGVVLADMALHQPDFRAAERAFALLTQVAGRAGRGDHPGRVVVQTYVPGHTAVAHARQHDYEAFYADEIARRRVLGMPPCARMVQLTLQAADPDALRDHATAIEGELLRAAGAEGSDRLCTYGPHAPHVARAKGEHRLRFALLGPSGELLRHVVVRALEAAARLGPPAWGRHRVILDVDPQDTA